MIALVVTGCGTEKVENKVTTITVDGKEKKGSYTGEFKTGKPHGNGVFKTQNKNGSRYTLTSHFKNGKPDGEAILRFESGSRNENVYKEGLLNGKCKSYFSNGKLGMEGEYKNGKQEGTFKQYYKSGKIAKECEYKNGKSTYEKLYYESGKLARLLRCGLARRSCKQYTATAH